MEGIFRWPRQLLLVGSNKRPLLSEGGASTEPGADSPCRFYDYLRIGRTFQSLKQPINTSVLKLLFQNRY